YPSTSTRTSRRRSTLLPNQAIAVRASSSSHRCFATGSRTSPAAKANATWTTSTDRAAASTTPRGTNTPSIILSPDREVRAPRQGWAPRAHEDRHDALAGGDTRALTLRRVRLPPPHECAPVLAGVKVVRPVWRSTL